MENEFDRLVDALPGLVWTARLDGTVDFLNQRWHAYTGMDIGEAKGHGWTGAIHPEDRTVLIERWQSILTTGIPLEMDGRLRRSDGEYRRFLFRTSPMTDASGKITKWCGVNIDIEDRSGTKDPQSRLSDEALSKVRSELAHLDRISCIGTLTASIAHEINQPLSGVVTNASTCLRMLTDPPDIEGAREITRRIIRDGFRASDVITRMRSLFGTMSPTAEQVDLNEATREVIALLLSELCRGGVIPRPELADGLPRVTGDRLQLQQVILNLLLNASDAMSGVHDRPRQLVIRTGLDEGDRVRLTVQDAGVGFDPRDADRLFEAFYTTKIDATGVGLSVSRSIIERHQGRLWAASNDGPGATFSFSIPLEPDDLGSHPDSECPGQVRLPDDPRMRLDPDSMSIDGIEQCVITEDGTQESTTPTVTASFLFAAPMAAPPSTQ
jgi:PAS domain S-box-containing protein